MTKTIYVVTDGVYSGYHIVAMFSERAEAEALLPLLTGDDKRVEEWSLDALKPGDGRVPFSVVSSPQSVEVAEVDDWRDNSYDWGSETAVQRLGQTYRQDGPRLRVTVMAKDAAHATKIAADRFRQYVAEHGWSKP